MRQGLATGLAISALVHAGVFFGSLLLPHPPAPRRTPEPKLPPNIIEVAPLPPADDPPTELSDANDPPVDVAAPTLPDRPQVAAPTDIVQRLEPPPPEGVPVKGDIYTIPEGHRGPLSHRPTIFDPDSLDQQPIARLRPPPQYPFEMRSSGQTGTVLVDFIVDSAGDVRNAYAVRSTQRQFEDAAVQAVRKWKFKPGRKAGQPVNTHMQVPIVFSLDP